MRNLSNEIVRGGDFSSLGMVIKGMWGHISLICKTRAVVRADVCYRSFEETLSSDTLPIT